MQRASMTGGRRGASAKRAALALLALAVALACALMAGGAEAKATPTLARTLARGQRVGSSARATAATASAEEAASAGVGAEALLSSRQAPNASAMHRIGSLRLRARSLIEGQARSTLEAGAAATLEAVLRLPKVAGRGAGGKAGRAGGKAGTAAGNAGQSGRKAGDAAGNGGQSGRKAGDAAGNGGQSGRKAGDASGNGGQSGRKAGTLPVSPITGSAPPDASNVFTLTGIQRKWPINVYLRNQGDAATCWAHSAITLLELRSQMALISNEMKEWYSVDQVVKCVKNDGAGGGSPLDALDFIVNAELMTDAEVRAGKKIKCDKINWNKRNSNQGRYSVLTAWEPCITPGENCRRMIDYEFQMNFEFMLTPMMAYVDASQWHTYAPKFKAAQAASYAIGTAADYSAVAFPTSKCSMDPVKGDHLVILLGTVTCPKTKKKYWRVYNSWGKEWGVNGYIYLPFEENACGLANYPVGLSLVGQMDVLKRPVLMLPRTIKQEDVVQTKKAKEAGGISGGQALYAYHMSRAKL